MWEERKGCEGEKKQIRQRRKRGKRCWEGERSRRNKGVSAREKRVKERDERKKRNEEKE